MATVRHPTIIGAYEAKIRFSKLLEKVEAGEEITITKHGTPVARLIPVKKKTTPQERKEAIERWKESSKGITLGGLKVRDPIDEWRP